MSNNEKSLPPRRATIGAKKGDQSKSKARMFVGACEANIQDHNRLLIEIRKDRSLAAAMKVAWTLTQFKYFGLDKETDGE